MHDVSAYILKEYNTDVGRFAFDPLYFRPLEVSF